MIEFKTENQEIFAEADNQLSASAKTVIVYVPASENEIKIENEVFLPAEKENVGDFKLTHRNTSDRRDRSQTLNLNDLTTHACNDCDAKLTSRKGLLSHCRKKHEKYLCHECDKVFDTRYKLNYHKKSHKPASGITEWKCDFENCDFTCSNRSGLIYHGLRHTGEKNNCTYCQKSFWRMQDLTRHLRTHTGERPYACDVCTKAYPSSRTLRNHKRSHTGEKPFICKFCQKAFAHSSSKQQHEMVHTGEQ